MKAAAKIPSPRNRAPVDDAAEVQRLHWPLQESAGPHSLMWPGAPLFQDGRQRMQAFLLGEWLVRPAENRLFGPLGERRLEPRVMELLCRLAQAGAGTVRRATLLNELWWDKEVGDEVLSTAVSALRRALGDDFRAPRYVETLPKAGYRLVQQPRPVSAGQHGGEAPTAALDSSHPAENQAQWLFRLGRYHFQRRSADNMSLCMSLFEQSIEADPGDASAHAWLALVCQMMPAYAPETGPEVARRARDLALAALGLERTEPIAHLVLANEAASRVRWVEADRYFQGALLNGPAEPTVHSAYAEFLSRLGHSRQALEHASRAWQLDGTSSGENLILGWMLLHSDELDRVARHADLAEQLGARAVFVDNLRGFVSHRRGWQPAELDRWQALDQRNASDPRWLWPGAVVSALRGRAPMSEAGEPDGDGKGTLHACIAAAAQGGPEGEGIAFFLSGLVGLPDLAFAYAEQAIARGNLFVVDPWLPELHGLHQDPRWAQLADHLGLSQAWQTLGAPDLGPFENGVVDKT